MAGCVLCWLNTWKRELQCLRDQRCVCLVMHAAPEPAQLSQNGSAFSCLLFTHPHWQASLLEMIESSPQSKQAALDAMGDALTLPRLCHQATLAAALAMASAGIPWRTCSGCVARSVSLPYALQHPGSSAPSAPRLPSLAK